MTFHDVSYLFQAAFVAWPQASSSLRHCFRGQFCGQAGWVLLGNSPWGALLRLLTLRPFVGRSFMIFLIVFFLFRVSGANLRGFGPQSPWFLEFGLYTSRVYRGFRRIHDKLANY